MDGRADSHSNGGFLIQVTGAIRKAGNGSPVIKTLFVTRIAQSLAPSVPTRLERRYSNPSPVDSRLLGVFVRAPSVRNILVAMRAMSSKVGSMLCIRRTDAGFDQVAACRSSVSRHRGKNLNFVLQPQVTCIYARLHYLVNDVLSALEIPRW